MSVQIEIPITAVPSTTTTTPVDLLPVGNNNNNNKSSSPPSVFTRRLLLHPRRRKLLPTEHPQIMLSEPAASCKSLLQQHTQRSREGLKLSFARSFSEPFGKNGSGLVGGQQPPVLSLPSLSPSLHPSRSKRSRRMMMDTTAVTPSTPTPSSETAPSPFPGSVMSPLRPPPSCVGLLRPTPPGSVSLPASPCSESSTLQRTLLLQKARTTSPAELSTRLSSSSSSRNFLILDCRPFIAYNVSHVRGAINVNCCDRFNRKRLQQGKATLADLATTKEGKEVLKGRNWREVVVYDDCSESLENLPVSHTLFLVMNSLVEDHREPIMLLGGLRDFQLSFRSFCDDHLMPPPSSSSSASSSFGSSFSSSSQLSVSSSFSSCSGLTSPLRVPQTCSGSLLPDLPSPSEMCGTKDIENHPPTQVLPHLYLGNMRDASEASALKQQGIKYVLNVTAKPPPYTPDAGIIYKQLQAADNGVQNLRQFFEEAFDFIEVAKAASAGVLVHCQAGVSRSPTIAVAYLMKYYHPMAMAEAYSFVKARRSIISPNLNFMGQLWEFEQGLRKDDTVKEDVTMEVEETVDVPSSASSSGSSNSSLTCKSAGIVVAEPFRWRSETRQHQHQRPAEAPVSTGCSV